MALLRVLCVCHCSCASLLSTSLSNEMMYTVLSFDAAPAWKSALTSHVNPAVSHAPAMMPAMNAAQLSDPNPFGTDRNLLVSGALS